MLKRVGTHWSWLDDVALPLATALMYAAWFYPLVSLFLRDPALGFHAPGLAFVLCLAILLTSLIAGRRARTWVGAVIVPAGSLVVGTVSLLAFFRLSIGAPAWWPASLQELTADMSVLVASVVVATSTAFLWWQGMRIGRTRYESVSQSFVIGVIALIGTLIIAIAVPLPDARNGGQPAFLPLLLNNIAPFSMLVYPASILAALLLAGLRHLIGEAAAQMAEWTIPMGLLFLSPMSPTSLPTEALIGPLFLFITASLVSLSLERVSRTRRTQERRYGAPVRVPLHWLGTALAVVGSIVALGLLLASLLAPVLFSIGHLPWPAIDWLPNVEGMARARRAAVSAPEDASPSPGFERFTSVVLLVGMLWIIWLIMAKRGQRGGLLRGLAGMVLLQDRHRVSERRDSIFTWHLFWDQLRALLGSLRPIPRPRFFVDPGAAGDSKRIIRELYQQVLARAIQLGQPRRRGQTPLTYMLALARLCPTERAALRTLTLSYISARYGVRPPPPEQVRATREAYARIGMAMDRAERAGRPLGSDPSLPL